MTAYTDLTMWTQGLTNMKANCAVVWITNVQPTTYTMASSTDNIGTATPGAGSVCAAPTIDAGTGANIVVNAVASGGSINNTGTAAFWGVGNVGNTVLYAGNSLSATQSVTSGNSFTTGAATIDLRGAT